MLGECSGHSRGRCRAALFLIASAALGSGCSLILDFGDDVAIDASTRPDAVPFCTAYEDDDTLQQATTIEAGVYDAAICGVGDVDFFAFSVDGNLDMIAQIRFDNRGGDGDLDMALLDFGGAVLPPDSSGFGDIETIDRSSGSANGLLPAGMYAVRIYGFNPSLQNSYQLELTLKRPPGADAGVPDAGVPDAGLP